MFQVQGQESQSETLNFERRPARYFPFESLENYYRSLHISFIARVSSWRGTLLLGP